MHKLSQAALAQACGLSQSAIANYENGSRKTAKNIFQLAEVLGVNPTWLAQGTGPMEPIPRLEQQTPSPHLVNESPFPRSLAPWPFQGISPDEYWSLTEDSRAIIESTLASLIKSLQDNLSES
ncbi:helix-turn-helix transcriptional regulator [Alcaligenaceae bacterium]|nr:helix-turn-helix transcriptional regulator [Alcaligenaceae bacterium]